MEVVETLIQTGDHLLTFDIEKGFHHVQIHKSDWKYFGCMWKGQYFCWTVLPNGVKNAPYYFNKIV